MENRTETVTRYKVNQLNRYWDEHYLEPHGGWWFREGVAATANTDSIDNLVSDKDITQQVKPFLEAIPPSSTTNRS